MWNEDGSNSVVVVHYCVKRIMDIEINELETQQPPY